MKKIIVIAIMSIIFFGCDKEIINNVTKDKYVYNMVMSPDGHIKVTLNFNTEEEYNNAMMLYEETLVDLRKKLQCDFHNSCDKEKFRR